VHWEHPPLGLPVSLLDNLPVSQLSPLDNLPVCLPASLLLRMRLGLLVVRIPGTKDATAALVCARTSALVMAPVSLMITASATLVLMGKQSGLDLIAL